MRKKDDEAPLVVGIGGAAKPDSSTDRALMIALGAAQRAGARTVMFGGAELAKLPHYLTHGTLPPEAGDLLAAVRHADGLILASPGYHGSISGLVKNAIDFLEEMAGDARPYLDGLPVGLVATAYGWQASVNTLHALRTIVHALRGWPTPLGAAVNSAGGLFQADGKPDPAVARQLDMVGEQVASFAAMVKRHKAKPAGVAAQN
jgi:FMN reductase